MSISRRDFLKIATTGAIAGYFGSEVDKILTRFNIDPVGKIVDGIKARVDKLENVDTMVVPLRESDFTSLINADYNNPSLVNGLELGRGTVTKVENGTMTVEFGNPDGTICSHAFDLTGEGYTSRMMRLLIQKDAEEIYFLGKYITDYFGETTFSFYTAMNGETIDGDNAFEGINIKGVFQGVLMVDGNNVPYLIATMREKVSNTNVLETLVLHPGTEIIESEE